MFYKDFLFSNRLLLVGELGKPAPCVASVAVKLKGEVSEFAE